MYRYKYRLDRVLGFFSSRPNWDPHPHTCRRVCPPFGSGGGTHSLEREGVRGYQIPKRGQTLCYSSRPTLRIIVTYGRLLTPIPHIRLHLYQPFTGSQEADTIYLALNRSCPLSYLHPWRCETLIPIMCIAVYLIKQSPSRPTFNVICR
jgi:hypothetical protein